MKEATVLSLQELRRAASGRTFGRLLIRWVCHESNLMAHNSNNRCCNEICDLRCAIHLHDEGSKWSCLGVNVLMSETPSTSSSPHLPKGKLAARMRFQTSVLKGFCTALFMTRPLCKAISWDAHPKWGFNFLHLHFKNCMRCVSW